MRSLALSYISDKQHRLLSLAVDGLYYPKELVREVLADDGTEKSILDLGTGAGKWAIGMAEVSILYVIGGNRANRLNLCEGISALSSRFDLEITVATNHRFVFRL